MHSIRFICFHFLTNKWIRNAAGTSKTIMIISGTETMDLKFISARKVTGTVVAIS